MFEQQLPNNDAGRGQPNITLLNCELVPGLKGLIKDYALLDVSKTVVTSTKPGSLYGMIVDRAGKILRVRFTSLFVQAWGTTASLPPYSEASDHQPSSRKVSLTRGRVAFSYRYGVRKRTWV